MTKDVFPIGTPVYLRHSQHGSVGTVLGTNKKKMRVRWGSYTGYHLPGQLVLAAEESKPPGKEIKPPDTTAEAPLENPYTRMLKRIDADNNNRQKP